MAIFFVNGTMKSNRNVFFAKFCPKKIQQSDTIMIPKSEQLNLSMHRRGKLRRDEFREDGFIRGDLRGIGGYFGVLPGDIVNMVASYLGKDLYFCGVIDGQCFGFAGSYTVRDGDVRICLPETSFPIKWVSWCTHLEEVIPKIIVPNIVYCKIDGKFRYNHFVSSELMKICMDDRVDDIICGENFTLFDVKGSLYYIYATTNVTGKRSMAEYYYVNRLIKIDTELHINKSIIKISCGHSYCLILTAIGNLYIVAFNPNLGGYIKKLYNGNLKDKHDVLKKMKLIDTDVTDMAAGSNHLGYVKASKIYMYGNNDYGQLGISSQSKQSDKRHYKWHQLTNYNNVSAIFCGYNHTAFVDGDKLYMFGENTHFQLGDDVPKSYHGHIRQCVPTPRVVFIRLNLENRIKVVFGSEHSLLLFDNEVILSGKQYCDGLDISTKLRSGSNGFYNIETFLDKPIDDIAVGAHHSFIISNGVAYAHGYNYHGQLSTPTKTRLQHFTPITITTPLPILKISCGNAHTAMLV